MLLQSTLSLALISFCGVVTAVPTPLDAIQMGSKHNIYLATCTRRSGLGECPLLIFCPEEAAVTYSAIAYFANGPIASTGLTTPSQIATVSEPPQPWEGAQRGAKLGRTSSVTASINAGANALEKGQIAGTAKMDAEDFVCFKDGTTFFEVRNELGGRQYSCTTEYWCPSIQV